MNESIGLKLEMAPIPAGEFLMGSCGSLTSEDEIPQHLVRVNGFSIGKYPITQEQWRVVATNLPKIERDLEPNPSHHRGYLRPVEQVSWHEAMEFCARLSAHASCSYRLPTEAEWEYACRAGTTTPFHFGEELTPELANYLGVGFGFEAQTTDVCSFPANAFGLYDMHGNVWEWCADHWHDSYGEKPEALKGDGNTPWTSSNTDECRLLRGGSWVIDPRDCRSAYRNYVIPDFRNFSVGFRVVAEVGGCTLN
jgi:formylglycine-generating enzyme required for sulfatase activity